MRKILVLLTVALIAVTSLVLVYTSERTGQRSALPANSEQGEALIGGDFTLTDTSSKLVRDADFRGKVMLVFFGFTHCPDICPVTVATMSKVMTALGTKANQVAPIFITVDPERDTPDVMAQFLSNSEFDKRIVGLTGTQEQIKSVAAVYRAYYAKNVMPGVDNTGYTVDHSGFIYVMGKDGKFIKAIPYNKSDEEMLALISPLVE
jgi:protein SCO1/2